jgi:molecular chaperone DnaK
MVPAQKRTFEFLPLSIGIETQGGIYTPLVLRGTPLPAKRWETFSTAADNQVSVEVALFLGESLLSENNIPLGKFHLKGIPPAARGKPQVKIEFSVDTSCAVTARAILEGSELRAEQAFYPPEELSDPFIAKTLANAEVESEGR